MKKCLLFILILACTNFVFAQTETYEYTSYTAPIGWQKEVKANTFTSYTKVNQQNNSYCRIIIMLSTNSKGTINEDFENEWQELVVKNYKPETKKETKELSKQNEWTIKKGTGTFTYDHKTGNVSLTTMSGFNRCVSIVAIANSDAYTKDIDAFMSSVKMLPVQIQQPELQTTTDPQNSNTVIGSWKATASDNSSFRANNGVMSYISRQYIFNANGSYSFTSKAYDPFVDHLIIGKETGTYTVNNNQVTISPSTSVLEGWSRKDGADKPGKLLSTQKLGLEKITYTFSKHYFSGIKEWSLILQANTPTKRDGPFSGNGSFKNAWLYGPISARNQPIELGN